MDKPPCDRLTELMKELRKGGVFRIVGLINDKFFTSWLKISSLEEVVAEILMALEYKAILFYSIQNGFYTINNRDIIKNVRELIGGSEDIRDPFVYLYSQIDKTKAFQYIADVLKRGKKTAVILPYGEAVRLVTENQDFFTEVFTEWDRNLSIQNNNVLVILDAHYVPNRNNEEAQRRGLPIIGKNCKDVLISLPLKDEVRRLIHYYRLVEKLELCWMEEECILKALVRSVDSLYSLIQLFNSLEGGINIQNLKKLEKKHFENPWRKLESLIGLDNVKEEIVRYVKQFKRGELFRPHLVFTGNPGVGKTTVARILAEILAEEGCLSRGHLVECRREDLVGQYVGETSQKVKKKVTEALGGVLFIDEAYAIDQGDYNGRGDFGREAIDTLTPLLENYRDKLVVIFAGYSSEMHKFLNRNPGLASRVPITIDFPDYSAKELEEIFYLKLNKLKKKYEISDALKSILRHIFHIMEKQTKEGIAGTYINARGMENLIDSLIRNVQGKDSSLLVPEHLPYEWKYLVKGINQELLEEVEAKLKELIGLNGFKQRLKEFIAVRKVEYKEFKEGKRKVLEKPRSLHFLFRGNPGTGKTTAAKIMGKVFKALYLSPPDAKVVEKKLNDIIGSAVGESERNLKDCIESARGGILFIDEAGPLVHHYGLFKTLIAEMEKRRDVFSVILAGYPHEIESLKEVDPGLESRVYAEIEFKDFTEEELWEILLRKLREKGLEIDEENLLGFKNEFMEGIRRVKMKKRVKFGNAREIEKLVDLLKNKRAFRIESGSGNPKIIVNDLENAIQDLTSI